MSEEENSLTNFIDVPDDVLRIIAEKSMPNERVALKKVNQECRKIFGEIKESIRREKKRVDKGFVVRYYSTNSGNRMFLNKDSEITEETLEFLQKICGFDIYPLIGNSHLFIFDQDIILRRDSDQRFRGFIQLNTLVNNFSDQSLGDQETFIVKIQGFDGDVSIQYNQKIKVGKDFKNKQFTLLIKYKKLKNLIFKPKYNPHSEENLKLTTDISNLEKLEILINEYGEQPIMIAYNEQIIIRINLNTMDSTYHKITSDVKKLIVFNNDNLVDFNKILFIYVDSNDKLYNIFSLNDINNYYIYNDRYLEIEDEVFDIKDEKLYTDLKNIGKHPLFIDFDKFTDKKMIQITKF
jgi:hypothetical protein